MVYTIQTPNQLPPTHGFYGGRRVTIEILVDPEAENYQQFHQGLEKEIGALNVEYSRGRVQAPPKTLSVEHDIVQYVINHPAILKLLHCVIDLVRTALERWKVKAD